MWHQNNKTNPEFLLAWHSFSCRCLSLSPKENIDHLLAYPPFCVQAKNLGLPSIQLIASEEEAILALVSCLSINGTSAYSDTQTKTYRSLLDHQVLFLSPLISFSAVAILVQSTNISCLDYCRSLLVDTVS